MKKKLLEKIKKILEKTGLKVEIETHRESIKCFGIINCRGTAEQCLDSLNYNIIGNPSKILSTNQYDGTWIIQFWWD